MIAELAEAAQRQRVCDLPGPSLSGAGWYAVRTGGSSNDLNGVVSDGDVAEVDRRRILDWLGDAPATWQTTRRDPALTEALVAIGADPERDGYWCGRSVEPDLPVGGAMRAQDPVAWSRVPEECDWYDDVEVRHPLLAHRFADPDWAHWWVVADDRPVAVLGGWCGEDSPVVEVVDVAVLPAYQRRGYGSALVAAAFAWASERGVHDVVAAPSPEGARLFGALGFSFEPVNPDVCFYLPDSVPR